MRRKSWLLPVCLNTFGQASFEVASIKPHPEPVTYSADARVNGTLVTATAGRDYHWGLSPPTMLTEKSWVTSS